MYNIEKEMKETSKLHRLTIFFSKLKPQKKINYCIYVHAHTEIYLLIGNPIVNSTAMIENNIST